MEDELRVQGLVAHVGHLKIGAEERAKVALCEAGHRENRHQRVSTLRGAYGIRISPLYETASQRPSRVVAVHGEGQVLAGCIAALHSTAYPRDVDPDQIILRQVDSGGEREGDELLGACRKRSALGDQ